MRHTQEPHLSDSVRDSLKHFQLLRRRQPSVHGENTEVLFHPGASEGPSLLYEHGNNSLHFLLEPEQHGAQKETGFTLTAHSCHLYTETAPKQYHCNCPNSRTLTSSLHIVIVLDKLLLIINKALHAYLCPLLFESTSHHKHMSKITRKGLNQAQEEAG